MIKKKIKEINHKQTNQVTFNELIKNRIMDKQSTVGTLLMNMFCFRSALIKSTESHTGLYKFNTHVFKFYGGNQHAPSHKQKAKYEYQLLNFL